MSATRPESTSPRQRQQRIRDRVLERGSITIEELVGEFDVSTMTIYRDLDVLDTQGWLRKVRGGATAQPSALFESNARYREMLEPEAKNALAHAAVEHIQHGQAVILDDSTTAHYLARILPDHGPLTLITNSLAIAKELAGEPNIALMMLGGTYYPAFDAFLGMATTEAIQPLRADTLVMSTSAVIGGYCYHQSQDIIVVKRALMESATRKILLVDHTKFAKRALHRLAPLTAFDLVIVDSATGADDIAALRDQGIPLQVAEPVGAEAAAR